MLPIANNGYSEADVLRRLRTDRAWLLPVRRLDYAFREIGYLGLSREITQASLSLDADSRPISATFSMTIRKSDFDAAGIDLFNEYFQPEVWVYMAGDQADSSNDGQRFAKFRQLVFSPVGDPINVNTQGVPYVQISMHEALSKLLDDDEITESFLVAPGDIVTDRIKALLAMSVIPRYSVTPSALTTETAASWQPGVVLKMPPSFDSNAGSSRIQNAQFETGVSLLRVLDDLCARIGYVRYTDASGTLNVRPWRDPAIEPICMSYTDQIQDSILPSAQFQRNQFELPNHLTGLSTPQGDDQIVYRAVAENKSSASRFSQASLRAPNGQSLIRHRVHSGIEAVSQAVLQQIVNREMLEIIATASTYEMRSRLKPYHEFYDVVSVTRADLGFSSRRFQVRKLNTDFRYDAEQRTTLREVIPLT